MKTTSIALLALFAALGFAAPADANALVARDGGEESTCCGGSGWAGYDEESEDKEHKKVHQREAEPVAPIAVRWEDNTPKLAERAADGGEESTCCGGSGWAGYDEESEDKEHKKVNH